MKRACIAAILVLFGCDDGLLDELPDDQSMAACIVPTGTASVPGGGEPIVVNVSGVVDATGRGNPPDGCFDTSPVAGWGAATGDIAWFQLVDGTDGWTVGIALDGVPTVRTGETVDVNFRFDAGGFSPSIGSMRVTDGRGELIWLGLAGDVGDLRLPDAIESIERAGVVYRQQDSCGTWEAFELEVDTVADGEVTLEYGEREDHGNASLFHGGYRHDQGKSSCPDWFVADLRVAWRRD